jgi:hypothetical protein
MKIQKFNNFLNEKVEEYDFGFKTVIGSSTVDYNNPTEDIVDTSKEQYITAGDLNMEWEMDFDNRKYGINSMGVIVHKITGYYTLVTPAETGRDEEDEKEFLYTKDSKDWEAECDFAGEFKFGYGINPQNIEIDFKTKKIFVTF